MHTRYTRIIRLTAAFALAVAQISPAMASTSAPGLDLQGFSAAVPDIPMFGSPAPKAPPVLLAFSEGATNTVVRRISSSESECAALPSEYRADCLSQGLRGAASLASKPDYAGARTQLSTASRQISTLVRQNADPSAAPLRKGGKTYRAVKKAAVRQVNAKAAAIVVETETKLIRAAGSSAHRKSHYQRIATAVGSTKRIFRS